MKSIKKIRKEFNKLVKKRNKLDSLIDCININAQIKTRKHTIKKSKG